jgi:hypothetical protein
MKANDADEATRGWSGYSLIRADMDKSLQCFCHYHPGIRLAYIVTPPPAGPATTW